MYGMLGIADNLAYYVGLGKPIKLFILRILCILDVRVFINFKFYNNIKYYHYFILEIMSLHIIKFSDYLPVNLLPFFTEIINIFPEETININLELPNDFLEFKDKNNITIKDLQMETKPIDYTTTKIQYEYILPIYKNNMCENNHNIKKDYLLFQNTYITCFNEIINKIKYITSSNVSEHTFNIFVNTLNFYRQLFMSLFENKELFDKINNDKNNMLRIGYDKHSIDKHNLKHNKQDLTKNNTYVIEENLNCNEVMFNDFYHSFDLIFNLSSLILMFLYDCYNNKVIPSFFKDLENEYTNFDIKNIFDDSKKQYFSILLFNFKINNCITDDTKTLNQPQRIQLWLDKATHKYKLFFDRNNSFIIKNKNLTLQKIETLKKIYVDKKKQSNK